MPALSDGFEVDDVRAGGSLGSLNGPASPAAGGSESWLTGPLG